MTNSMMELSTRLEYYKTKNDRLYFPESNLIPIIAAEHTQLQHGLYALPLYFLD